uniref:NADH-ubiquinone oxidoreductase chain 2 n=1 Tax=Schizocephala bicornis TaxID=444990 RepID=A0A343UN79_9NEOP|nr:NADH dehydrogenase subunit 2 [Schizocephala bicornis]AVE15729.1 NADH dehydrogenase subunit 2 [Schizocephala bicornis]
MPNNSTKILFLMTLISGMLISLSANSWLGAWMGLEINLLSLIPLLSSNQNMFSTEASIKYFLTQTLASSSLLFLILLKINTNEYFHFDFNFSNNLIMIPLLLKIGCAPFHWWLPPVVEGSSWMNSLLILSVQKVAPFILISYIIMNSIFIQLIIIISSLTGAIGGLNQTSIRKILSFSSINHIAWMLLTMTLSLNLWFLYFAIYMINITIIIMMAYSTNISFILQSFNSLNDKKIFTLFLLTSFMSLGGLPPFLGFFPKWITINFMMQNLLTFTAMILIMSSLITLFYYLRIMYSSFMLISSENFWLFNLHFKKFNFQLAINLMINMLGMLALTLILLVC